MTRLRLALLLGVTALVGLGAGYLAGRRRSPPPRTVSDSEEHGRRRAPSDCPSSPLREPGSAAVDDPGHAAGVSAELLRSVRQRALALAEENRSLRARLEEELRERRSREGTPTPWPAEAPDRFRQDPLTRAVNDALREVGWKGEVTDVDCKEFPCVLVGHLEGSLGSEEFKRLLRVKALAPYAGDHAHTSVAASTLRDSLGRPVRRTQFGIAFGPGAPPGTEPDVQRTVGRMRLLLDTSRER